LTQDISWSRSRNAAAVSHWFDARRNRAGPMSCCRWFISTI